MMILPLDHAEEIQRPLPAAVAVVAPGSCIRCGA
jgi:hypothetical protein